MTETALTCDGLEYRTPDGVLFDQVYLRLDIGQRAAVLSTPSDRGRMLVRICATLAAPTGGYVTWFGKRGDLLDREDIVELRRKIGWVNRGSRLVSNMTLMDNFILGLMYNENVSRAAAKKQVREIVEQFGLYDIRDMRPSDITFEKHRLAVYIREMIKRPKLFILEAPFLDLDENFDLVMSEIMKRVHSGEAAFFITDIGLEMCRNWVDWLLVIEESGNRLLTLDMLDEESRSRYSNKSGNDKD